jgi:hypothetical protein
VQSKNLRKGVTHGRSQQYGNKYKHISTINRAVAGTIQFGIERFTRTFVIRIEDYFAG